MRNKKMMLIEQLDKKIEPFHQLENIPTPNLGWIHTIRSTLNMTLSQLGAKLGITKQGVKNLEESESKGTITINSLKEIGSAMRLKFVYGFVPYDTTLENLVTNQAIKLAKEIVLRANQTMKLEDQKINKQQLDRSINDLAMELKRDLNKSIWELN